MQKCFLLRIILKLRAWPSEHGFYSCNSFVICRSFVFRSWANNTVAMPGFSEHFISANLSAESILNPKAFCSPSTSKTMCTCTSQPAVAPWLLWGGVFLLARVAPHCGNVVNSTQHHRGLCMLVSKHSMTEHAPPCQLWTEGIRGSILSLNYLF